MAVAGLTVRPETGKDVRAVELDAPQRLVEVLVLSPLSVRSDLQRQGIGSEQLGCSRPSVRIPPAACQVVRLSSYEDWMTGVLGYPDVFWQHDAVGLRGVASG